MIPLETALMEAPQLSYIPDANMSVLWERGLAQESAWFDSGVGKLVTTGDEFQIPSSFVGLQVSLLLLPFA